MSLFLLVNITLISSPQIETVNELFGGTHEKVGFVGDVAVDGGCCY